MSATDKRINRKICKHCGKTPTEIVFESKLAAANARIAELERQKAELHKCLIFDGEILGEYQQKLKQAEAQNKLMREALNEIANSNLQTIDWAMKRWIDSRVVNIAKAALEV